MNSQGFFFFIIFSYLLSFILDCFDFENVGIFSVQLFEVSALPRG